MNFEEIYELYKLRDDKVKIIDGIKYYKIIEKTNLLHFVIIALPKEMFTTSKTVVKDDNGNVLDLGRPAHYNFVSVAPKWYYEVYQFGLENVSLDEIGEYVTLVK